MKRRYAVVGGGVSGLTAAYRLRRAVPDAHITVFDPADRLGGILRTERLAGQTMEIGAEAFVVRRPEMPALLAELGLADRRRVPTGVRPQLYSEGRLHPLPAGTVNGLPSSAASMAGLVDPDTLARIAAEPGRALPWRPGDDPSVAALVGDRFGEQVVTRSVDPMLSGVYAGSSAGIGLRSAVPTVAAELDRGAPNLTAAVRAVAPSGPAGPVFGAIDGGYRVLLDALVSASDLVWRPNSATALAADGDRWCVVDDEGVEHRVDAVVLAAPVTRAAALLAGPAPAAAELARRIPVASSVVVALAVPGGTPLPAQSGVLVATGERLHAKAITLSTRKWGATGNVELLRMSFGRFGDTVAASVADDRLLAWAVADLQTVFGIAVDPVDALTHRWLDAMPQYGPGHLGLVARLRAELPPGLALAGNYLDGVGVPACLAAAGRAVASLLGSR
ncbi:protoporphyrinogen oxidase [Mycolicibacterium brumae]|uniref:Coproporphyrinogen III oxidase n=1 Tax=Mycolicibacterium brumae TaxID=85968 RepID=A0A2G5PE70_9MYCO|nr:protoporphyrinogen oxidase [Mycolicibacterium brumae]MCV7193530.1 protoporphyrinogen oxidase [Mycolicibacterium brumae]PIB76204.1 protoporphyrinogen oxidase [Mycolicibacterium brumae]UWW09197.1 protoporphyrinogen oxidase [Mycolicibacterium brumae]